MDEINLIEDVIQICKYLAWQNNTGDEKANQIIKKIHEGKYNSYEGIWPQTEKALNKIKTRITNRST